MSSFDNVTDGAKLCLAIVAVDLGETRTIIVDDFISPPDFSSRSQRLLDHGSSSTEFTVPQFARKPQASKWLSSAARTHTRARRWRSICTTAGKPHTHMGLVDRIRSRV